MSEKSFDVIVVGAGFAGVTAARDLRDRGLSVLLLEAGDRVGGRAYSKQFPGRDAVAEYGGTWVVRAYHHDMAREIERYDIPMHFGVGAERAIFHTGGERREGAFIPPEDFVQFEAVCLRLIDAARRINPLLPIYDQPVGDLDCSLADFVAPMGLSAATHDLLNAYFSLHCSGHPDEASMLMIHTWTAGFGCSVSKQVMSLSEIFDHGTAHLLGAMLEGSEPDLRLETPVKRIVQGDGEVSVETTTGESFAAAAAVVAVPTNVLGKIEFEPLLGPDKRVAEEPHVGRGYKVNMVVENIEPTFCLGWGGPLTAIFPLAWLADGGVLMTGFGGESIEPIDPTSVADAQRSIEHFAPQAKVVACDAHDWNRDPYFDGTWRTDRPGRAHLFAKGLNEPEGRLTFAGSDMTHTPWQNWFEGAVASGHRAAGATAARLGVRGSRGREG